MTRLSQIDQEPKIGRYLAELANDRQYLDFFPLDDAADLDRVPFFYPEPAEPGIGPFGQHMLNPAFRRYRHDPLIAYEFADVHLLGVDGVAVLDSGVVRNSLDHTGHGQAGSNIAEARGRDYLKLRRPMPVATLFEQGRYAIGFNGGWRDHAQWLLQCMPKLYAFTLLRRRFKDLRLVLPPLPPGSAQSRTLELLGIGPEAVQIVAPNEVTCFASAILLPNFDLWAATNFLGTAAEAMIARLPTAPGGPAPRADKVYVHRTVRGRAVANFDALRPLLERYGFAVVSFEGMDLAEQMATMQAARHVISEHGAGSANILFCREATRVLELFNPFCVQPAFWTVAARRGLDYGYLVGSHAPTEAAPQPSWNAAYAVPPDKFEDAIRATLRLPPRPAAATATAAPPSAAASPPPPAATAAATPAPVRPVPAASAPLTTAVPRPVTGAAAAFPVRAPSGPVGMGVEAPTGGFAGIVTPSFEVANSAARLGRAGGHERLPLFSPAMPPPQLPVLAPADLPPAFVEEHGHYPATPPVVAYAIGGGVLWSTGLVTHGSQFVGLPDCLPGYFNDHFRPGAPPLHPIHGGAMGRSDVRTITLEHPVAVATHPNLGYGRVMLEVLPRLWLLSVLREYGADIPLALSRTVPDWVRAFALLFHAERNIVWYDGANERLRAPSIVMPSMLHTECNFHPAMNLMVRDLLQRLPPPDAASPKLVYFAGANFGEEMLENQAEVEQAMLGLGFAVVRLAALTPVQQLRLFAGARVLAGEHGYALHGALFSPPGTRIVAINFANHYQSAISRLRGHRIAYVPPADGQFRHWRLTGNLSRSWKVDVALLRQVTGQVLQGVAP